MKSRIFSQISFSERGSKVPSPTWTWINCSMAKASGSLALRARMGGSRVHGYFFFCGVQGCPHANGGSASFDVVNGQNIGQGQSVIKRLAGLNSAKREVLRRQLLKFATLLQA